MMALVAILATRDPSQKGTSKIVGQAAPEFSGRTLDGQNFRLSTYRGEWVVVNFFATWCTPCRIEHPQLVEFVERHRNDPVQVVSLAYGNDQEDDLRQFFAEEGGDWPVIPADTGLISLNYGVTGVPESYVVAPSGQVIARFEGVTADGLDEAIDQAGGMAAASGS